MSLPFLIPRTGFSPELFMGRTNITVSDNGPGIEDEIVEGMFIPFFTTRETGSGIRLSLCRQIIHLHKGSINLESGKDPGATVVLRFQP